MNPDIVAKGITGFKHWLFTALRVLAIIGILWAIYVMAIKPHTNPTPTESQTAEKIENFNYSLTPRQTFFGCANYRIQNPKAKEIKE